MKKKRILFIIWSYTYGGGAEKVLSNLVNKLSLDKYEIDILEYWHSNIKREKTAKEINLLKPVVDSTKASKLEKIIKKILLERFPYILRKLYIKKKYDYEISWNSMIPTFLLDKNGKTISWNHGSLYDLSNKEKDQQKKSFEHIKKIVAISQKTYNSIIELYPMYKDKTYIINNSFDFNDIIKLSEEVNVKKPQKHILLFVGRLDKNKNPLFLIEVAKKLNNQKIDFELWLIGTGELEDKLKEAIKNYNLDNIKILGYKKNPYPYFKIADLILLSSYSEGFPTVIAEGLVFGKPFVSTDVGGTLEMSANGRCGKITNDLDEYVKNIKEILSNKELYKKMSEEGKKHIKKFTYKNQIKKLEHLFEELD